MKHIVYYKSPIGLIKLCEDEGCLVELSFMTDLSENEDLDFVTKSPLLKEVCKQLSEYFEGNRFQFDFPLKQSGTPFQQKAWDYLQTIPYGGTVSYKQEAEAIGRLKAFRAVGSANGKNNIAIIIPCHRVVNSNGNLGGYAYGLSIKEKLLKMEKEFLEKK